MPYDSNGNATITRNRAVTGQTVQAAQVNVPFDDVQSMLSQVLLRSGVAPMTGILNMNGFKITNVGDAISDNNAVNFGQLNASINGISKPWSGYISPSFNLSNNISDTDNDIDFPSGMASSSETDPIIMVHFAATSQLDLAYGTGNGGRFDSSISDGTWHCFIISNGSTVSRGFSKSLNPITQPNFPSGFSHYRRVASIIRISGSILGFIQRDDFFDLSISVMDRNTPSAVGPSLQSISVPYGIVVQPILSLIQVQSINGNCQTSISSPGSPLRLCNITTLSNEIGTHIENGGIFTNNTAQIFMEVAIFSGSISDNSLRTFGWIDTRGKS